MQLQTEVRTKMRKKAQQLLQLRRVGPVDEEEVLREESYSTVSFEGRGGLRCSYESSNSARKKLREGEEVEREFGPGPLGSGARIASYRPGRWLNGTGPRRDFEG